MRSVGTQPGGTQYDMGYVGAIAQSTTCVCWELRPQTFGVRKPIIVRLIGALESVPRSMH